MGPLPDTSTGPALQGLRERPQMRGSLTSAWRVCQNSPETVHRSDWGHGCQGLAPRTQGHLNVTEHKCHSGKGHGRSRRQPWAPAAHSPCPRDHCSAPAREEGPDRCPCLQDSQLSPDTNGGSKQWPWWVGQAAPEARECVDMARGEVQPRMGPLSTARPREAGGSSDTSTARGKTVPGRGWGVGGFPGRQATAGIF